MSTYFKHGAWNVICDVCGKEYKSDQIRKRWDGLMVCDHDFEHRHISDFIRVPAETNRVQDARPEPTDQFVEVVYCSVSSRNCRADYGGADCMTVGFLTPDYT